MKQIKYCAEQIIDMKHIKLRRMMRKRTEVLAERNTKVRRQLG